MSFFGSKSIDVALLRVAEVEIFPGFRTLITRNRGWSMKSLKKAGFCNKSSGEILVSFNSVRVKPHCFVALI